MKKVTKEAALVLTFAGVYEFLRTDMVQDGHWATAHALAVVHVESALGIFHEQSIQRLFLRAPDVVKLCNLYYGGTHFAVPTVALLWLAFATERYVRARTVLGVTTAAAFAFFWAFPRGSSASFAHSLRDRRYACCLSSVGSSRALPGGQRW